MCVPTRLHHNVKQNRAKLKGDLVISSQDYIS